MGKRDYFDPMTMAVRDIPEVFDECRKVVFTRLPGTNKFVAATWAALVEAINIYQFAQGVIDDEKDKSDRFVWTYIGEHKAAAGVIRKIADGLGVSNFKPREGEQVEQVRQGGGDPRSPGSPGAAGGDGNVHGLSGVQGPELSQAVPDPEGGPAVGEGGHPGMAGQDEPART